MSSWACDGRVADDVSLMHDRVASHDMQAVTRMRVFARSHVYVVVVQIWHVVRGRAYACAEERV